MRALEELRQRIRDLDGEILRLVAARMEAARQVGELKKAAGVPLRDYDVERQVLALAAVQADALGLAPHLARSVMQLLIAESREEQERQTYSSYSGGAERILIVGGRGKMGRWLGSFFRNQGHEVLVYDLSRDAQPDGEGVPTLEAGLARASCTVISTSLEAVPAVIDEIAWRHYSGVMFDIASLKGHLRPALDRARAAGVPVTSIHPMFGPSARTLSDKVICVCDCGDPQATRVVEGFFRETAASLVRLSLEEHDRLVASVLGLSHLINLLFVRVLVGGGDGLEALRRVGSTTFLAQLATSATVIRENPELYFAIQRLNPFTPRVYRALTEAVQELTGLVRDNDQAGFAAVMEAGRSWMGDHDTH